MKKETGITRKVDELGRVVIPMELRRNLNIPVGTPMLIYVDGEDIIFRRVAEACACCGKERDDLVTVNGAKLCKACVIAIAGYASDMGREAAKNND